MIARDVMTPNPVTVTRRASLAEVRELMRERDIRHVPIVEAGALVGIVSDRDLAYLDNPHLLAAEGIEAAKGVDAIRDELARPVATVMRSDVIFAEPETGLDEVIGLLLENKIGAIPVIRPDTREVVGIISHVDVLRAAQPLFDDR